MGVTRLRTRRDAAAERGMARWRDRVLLAPDLPMDLASRLAQILDRELSSRAGWKFVMVDPKAIDAVAADLERASRRPTKALRLLIHLFGHLPPDGNEVLATRGELARGVGLRPQEVSTIMGELAGIGAVECRKEGRGVRYYVNPRLGTHLGGAARDRAQAGARALRLVPEPAA